MAIMTRITFRGSSRVLGASIIGASLLFAGALPAAATGPAESPAQSTQQTTTSDVDELEIVLGIDAEVAKTSMRFTFPASITAEQGAAASAAVVEAATRLSLAFS